MERPGLGGSQSVQPRRLNVLIGHVGCQDIGELHTSAISILQ
jgi:hypothetical protein